jgi:dihydroorotate dehydrogenase electron transfer subunit
MASLATQVVEIATTAGHLSVRCVAPAPGIGAPGQFFLAGADGRDAPFLRAPLFPFSTQTGQWEFWVDPAQVLAQLQPGDTLDLIGPLGRGFSMPSLASRLLLRAHTLERLFPLVYWALARQWSIVWIVPDELAAWPLPSLPPAVEVQRGPLTAELAEWAEVVALDVPDPGSAARDIRALCPPRPAAFVQALVTPLMPCGVGACQACWVETRRRRQLACVDGPAFSL